MTTGRFIFSSPHAELPSRLPGWVGASLIWFVMSTEYFSEEWINELPTQTAGPSPNSALALVISATYVPVLFPGISGMDFRQVLCLSLCRYKRAVPVTRGPDSEMLVKEGRSLCDL